MPPSLTVVGTGFLIAGHSTAEMRSAVESADVLLHLVADEPTRGWLATLNPRHESLYDAYRDGVSRSESYAEMVERMLAPLAKGQRVCAAFYGHPGVFATPGHEAIRRARAVGIQARMLPAVSAEDCLFADLEIDPGQLGCQSYEASYFLLRKRTFDPTSLLVLWQIGGIGVSTFQREPIWNREGLRLLADTLQQHYPADHEVVVYRASGLPVCPPQIDRIPLSGLGDADVSIASTLLVPPRGVPDAKACAVARLGLPQAPVRGRAGTVLARPPAEAKRPGRLTVVGLGYSVAGQVTLQTEALITQAEQLFFLVTDPVSGDWLRDLNPTAESLHRGYREGESGERAVEEMVARIQDAVTAGKEVVAAFTGHPGIFLHMAHEAMAAVRAEGHAARLLPGVSFEDCLIADLGLDPAQQGRSLFEATDLVTRPRTLDTTTALVVLQPGCVGVAHYRPEREAYAPGLRALAEALAHHYPPEHPVWVYEAAHLPIFQPVVHRVPLRRLDRAPVSVVSTLYVPPLMTARRDELMASRLTATLEASRSAKVAV